VVWSHPTPWGLYSVSNYLTSQCGVTILTTMDDLYC